MFATTIRPALFSVQSLVKSPRYYSRLSHLPDRKLNSALITSLSPSSFTLLQRTMATAPSGTTMKGPLTAAIAEDHQEMYEYYDQYKQARSAGDFDKAERWARQLIWEVARHAVGEEIVVYPLMEKHLGSEGLRLANEDRKDHQLVKNNLYKLDGTDVQSEEYDTLLSETMSELHNHNDNEETKDLPLLEPEIGAGDSEKAASSFKLTKKFVPTRAHPSAPNQPPLETLAGFLVAPIDKLKDAFAKFPTEEMKEEAKS